jgi:hypothetical protein
MRRILLCALAVVAAALAGAPVAAQDGPNVNVSVENGGPTATPAPGPNAQQLDQGLRVVRATYDEDSGTATVVFETDDPRQVVVTDAGGVWEGGKINQVRKVLPSGKSRIRLSVTEVEGDVAVTVGIESGLYGVPIEEQSYLFTEPATWQDAQLSGFAGLSGGLLAAGVLAYRRKNSGKKDWEREL